MPYLLDTHILFFDADGYLVDLNTNQKYELPVTASVTLAFLLENHGKTVARSSVMEHIFISCGYNASNNTLTQYMSLIRKTLTSAGLLTTFITTIPKVGFHINENISIEKVNINYLDSRTSDYTQDVFINDKIICRNKKHMLEIFFVIFLCITCGLTAYLSIDKESDIIISGIGQIGECPVYVWGTTTISQNIHISRTIQETAARKLPCNTINVYFFYPDILTSHNDISRIFLTRCERLSQSSDDAMFSNCEGLYLHEKN